MEALSKLIDMFKPNPAGHTIEHDGEHYVLRNNQQELQLLPTHKLPKSIKERMHVSTIDSLARYVNRFGGAHSIVVHNESHSIFAAHSRIDYHLPDAPQRVEHTATLEIETTPEYKMVVSGLGEAISQKLAVQWLDDITEYIRVPTDDAGAPSAVEITDLVRKLSITSTAHADIKADQGGETTSVSYSARNTTSIDMPKYFIAAVRVFPESEPVGIKIVPSVRTEAEAKGATFTFRAPALDIIWDREQTALREKLFDAVYTDHCYQA